MNGQSTEAGPNLEAALKAIRNEEHSRLLWIDALCIDQSSKKKRNQQILLMADIYRKASCVLIWLGLADSTTDLAFDTVEELCWSIKFHIWDYCSKRFRMPIAEVNMNLVENMLDNDMPKFCMPTS
jgi:SAM-dependent MidA family methyltransferase